MLHALIRLPWLWNHNSVITDLWLFTALVHGLTLFAQLMQGDPDTHFALDLIVHCCLHSPGQCAEIALGPLLLLGIYSATGGCGGLRKQPLAQFSFVFTVVTCGLSLTWFLLNTARFDRLSDWSVFKATVG